MHATLWHGTDETSALRRTILKDVFDAAAIPLDVVSTQDELLAVAARSRRASDHDFLIMDCAIGSPSDVDRCVAVATRTPLPIHIIHPSEEIVRAEIEGYALRSWRDGVRGRAMKRARIAAWTAWLPMAVLAGLLSACGGSPARPPHPPAARRATGPVLQTTRLGQWPFALAADAPAGRVLVLASNNPNLSPYHIRPTTVQILDAATGAIVRTVPLTDYVPHDPAGGTNALTVDPRNGQAFLASAQHVDGDSNPIGRASLRALDGRTGRAVWTVALPSVGPCVVALDARTHRIFVGLVGPTTGLPSSTARVAVIDERTGTLLRSVPVGGMPCLAGVDTRGGVVFFGDAGGQDVVGLDAETGSVHVKVVLSADEGTIESLAVDERAGRVLVGQFAGVVRLHNLSVLDAQTGRRLATVDGVGGAPLVVDAATGHAFGVKRALSSNNMDNIVVHTVETRTGRLVQQVELVPAAGDGEGAALAVDAARGRVFAVPVPDDARLHVLDARSGRQLRAVTLGGVVQTLAVVVDERTARVFVSNADAGTVSVLDAARL